MCEKARHLQNATESEIALRDLGVAGMVFYKL